MTLKDYYVDGDWDAVCYECGRKRKASYLKRHWQGYYVCPEHWEPRHPQDFVRGIQEHLAPPWVQPWGDAYQAQYVYIDSNYVDENAVGGTITLTVEDGTVIVIGGDTAFGDLVLNNAGTSNITVLVNNSGVITGEITAGAGVGYTVEGPGRVGPITPPGQAWELTAVEFTPGVWGYQSGLYVPQIYIATDFSTFSLGDGGAISPDTLLGTFIVSAISSSGFPGLEFVLGIAGYPPIDFFDSVTVNSVTLNALDATIFTVELITGLFTYWGWSTTPFTGAGTYEITFDPDTP